MDFDFPNYGSVDYSETSLLKSETFSINTKKEINQPFNNSGLDSINNINPLEDKYMNVDEPEKNNFNNILDYYSYNAFNKNDYNNIFLTNENYSLNSDTNETNNKGNNNYPEIKMEKEKQEEKIEVTIQQPKDSFPKDFYIFKPGNENKSIRIEINNNQNNIMLNVKSHSSQKRKRRGNSDNMRKKIKTKFINSLIKFTNKKLENAGSQKYFHRLSYSFVNNISKDENRDMFNKTFRELFSTNFGTNRKADLKNYEKNKDVLEYLENEKDISQKSNYNVYKNLKFCEIFEEYLRSQEFENEIEKLKLDEEEDVYICRYIKLACNLNKFFSQ